jgi:hypothetical protein
MVNVRYVLEPSFTGVVIHRNGEMLRIRWDDGREMTHHISEVENIQNRGIKE